MERSWNAEKGFFAQSYEDLDVLDSAVLVMPLVFFINGKSHLFFLPSKAYVNSGD